jgi:hypothetical protein
LAGVPTKIPENLEPALASSSSATIVLSALRLKRTTNCHQYRKCLIQSQFARVSVVQSGSGSLRTTYKFSWHRDPWRYR